MRTVLFSMAAALIVFAVGAGMATAQNIAIESIDAAAADRVPEGLNASDWSSIRAAYEAGRHAAFADGDGYQARNPGQQWRTRFDGRGFLTTPDAGDWSWGLELVSYGREGAQRAVTAPSCVEADGGRVSYQWDEVLTEWYVNNPRGLEHGYTIQRRPVAKDVARASRPWMPHGEQSPARLDQSPDRQGGVGLRSCGPIHSQPDRSLTVAALNNPADRKHTGETPVPPTPLQLTLAVRGGLHPRVTAGGRNVTFVNDAGAAVVNYHGLVVHDAGGTALPAWFAASGGALVLHVVNRGARYPLTIDPIAQQAYLKASNTDSGDDFGCSVAASGDTVVVGALLEDSSATGVNGNQADNSAVNAGAAYVFVKGAGGVWSQQAYLKASNTDASDFFGGAVAASGDTVVVGANGEQSSATGVNGNQADNSDTTAGAAYVFVRDAGGVWSQQAYLKASNTDRFDLFGFSVAASGDTVVVGAPREDSNATGVNGNQVNDSAPESGAAYVFVRDAAGVWSQQAYLKASNTDSSDRFGFSVAASGVAVVVGASFEGSSATGVNGNQVNDSAPESGAAYVFVRDAAGVWSQQAYLKASNTDVGDFFGGAVAASGNTVVVGAPGEDSNATGVNGNQADNCDTSAGAAYVFVRVAGGVWSQQAYLKDSNIDIGGFGSFGFSVAASGDTVVVGAFCEDSNATGVNGNQADSSASGAGAAYVFVRDAGGVWSQQAYLKASNTDAQDQFGTSVAASGDTVVVGAPFESSSATGVDSNQADNSAMDSGAAYVFFVPPDCNANGIEDATDIANGTSQDVIGAGGLPDGIPDECQIDCNNNLIPDFQDIAAGTSQDCNANGIPDECDIAAGTSIDVVGLGGLPDGIPDECQDCNNNGILDDQDIATGTSQDCNLNGVPDECEVSLQYIIDDGVDESGNGVVGGGDLIWLNQFTVRPGFETISTVDIAWNLVAVGTPTTIVLWGDPNNDGDPTDAVVLRTVGPIPVTNPNTSQFTSVDIPPTFVGHAGNSFFVGAFITLAAGESPASLDETPPSQGRSWIAGSNAGAGNINSLPNNGFFGSIDSFGFPGNWLLRAGMISDCNANGIPDDCDIAAGSSLDVVGAAGLPDGIPDECQSDCNNNLILDDQDIASGTSQDCNANGIPDECDIVAGTSMDCDGDGVPDNCQIVGFIYQADDGTHESSLGLANGGYVAWMNHFQTVAGSETLSRIGLAWGTVANGTSVTVYLWSDPNGDGNPTDAQVLTSAATTVQNADTDVLNPVDIQKTFVGPAGTSFFVGGIIQHQAGEKPMSVDTNSPAGATWIAGDGVNPIDPNNLGAAGSLPPTNNNSVALVRAQAFAGDCNNNGVPDSCDPESSDVALFVSQLLSSAPDPVLVCMLDGNGDQVLDGVDIQAFVDRLLGP